MSDGPPPKENAIRRNVRPTGHLEGQDVPDKLKKLRNRSTYSAYTQEWWDIWVDSTQSESFFPTDWMVLQRLAMLVEAFVRRPGHNAAAEIRQQESLLGATVLDRMRLRMNKKDDGKASDALPPDVANFMEWAEKNA
jgi:hypothetical protein